MPEQPRDGIQATIEWEQDDQVRAQFVNHALISFDGPSFYIRFYQVLPPVISSANAAEEVTTVKGRHVVTLAISAESMPGIVEAMQRILDQYQGKSTE
ncbi:MAG: hypothetical protein GXP39_08085 [Chloroflexi bacterium]|nr:hypothetical protein [Chloroflexota bacterium]